MWRRSYWAALGLGIALMSGITVADDGALDVTIKVLESPTDTPEQVTRTIKLPPAAARKPVEAVKPGRDVGRDTRDAGRDHRIERDHGPGGGIADDARREGDRGKGRDKNRDRGRGRP